MEPATLAGGATRERAIKLLESAAQEPSTLAEVLQTTDFPIIEGNRATFVYYGEADSVHLRHFLYGLPSTFPFERLSRPDLWVLTMEIPARARIEYKLEVSFNGGTRLLEDPLNPNKAHDPFGANSVLHGPGYEVPEWTLHDPEARPGSLEDLVIPSRSLRRNAEITIYLPARFRESARYPLLLVHDGGDFLKYSSMKTVLDNLIHRLEVSEMIVAFLHPRDRLREYPNNAAHARFLTRELIPHLEERWPLIQEARGRCLMGASFGAVASLSAATRYPGFYGSLLLQSGSFAFSDIGQGEKGTVYEPVVKFMNAFRESPQRMVDRIFISCGIYEGPIYLNRSLVPILTEIGIEARYIEARDGHNWENWRDRLRDGLSWLLPGPLRMVYE